MFGERYFATRERLMEVIRGVVDLGEQTQSSIGQHLAADAVRNGLTTPFLFVVFGEVNAGKSTLFNGLFGSELCKVNVLPETERVMYYLHGEASRDLEISPTLEECHRPHEFLKDFNLVDTPGTNSVARGHLSLTDRFLPVADLILFVFPISNPWGASTWDFLGRLPEETLKRVALVIQQIDQRDPADVPVILGHMRDLSIKRTGLVPPIFAVSGKLAVEAKKSEPFARDGWTKSGFQELEDFISRSVCQSSQRLKLLDAWRQHAADALRTIEDRMEETARNVDRCARFLAEVEREIDGLRNQFVIRLPRHLTGVAEVFQTEAVWVAKRLNRKLGPLKSLLHLFLGDKSGSEIEAWFVERLQTAVENVAEKDATETASICESHWNHLVLRVKAEMGVSLPDASGIQPELDHARKRFVRRLGRTSSMGIGNLKVRHGLDVALRQRNTALKTLVAASLLGLSTAGTCGFFLIPWVPWICLGASLAIMGIALVYALLSRLEIVKSFRERLLDACGSFANALRGDYEEALRVLFQDYAGCLKEIRRHVANERLALEPRQQRWNELFLALKAIEQDL